MTINIYFNESLPEELDLDLLKQAIYSTLEHHDKADVDITLFFSTDAHIAQLNEKYRGITTSTDVLAFNQDFIDPDTGKPYLGDIIISLNQAQKQAHKAAHSLLKECALLAIHGTLHLLGYDHNNASAKKAMWNEQNSLLKILFPI